MRIKRKVINILQLSEREIQVLMGLVEQAKEGHISHYAEEEIAPGQFFGVSVAESHDARNQMTRKPFEPVPTNSKYC